MAAERVVVQVRLGSVIRQSGVSAVLRSLGFEVHDATAPMIIPEAGPVLIVDESWLTTSAGCWAEFEMPLVIVGPVARSLMDIAALCRAGWAWLPDEAGVDELRAGVLAAAAGMAACPAGLLPELSGSATGLPALAEPLTPREREVLDLIAQGLSNKRVAQRLGVSENTVKFHVQALFGKLSVTSRAGAASRAIQLGLIIV